MLGEPPRGPPLIAAMFLLATLLVLTPPTHAQPPTAEIDTTQPVTFHGQTQAQGANGLLATWNENANFTLHADTLTLHTEWAKGELIPQPQGANSPLWVKTDEGQKTTHLEDATLTATPWKTPTQLLLEPQPATQATAQATGETQLKNVENHRLAWAGLQDAHASTQEHPNYDHEIQTPTLLLEGADLARATGTLDLFINNATLTARTHDDEWEDWTGFRTQDATGPTRTYEIRITTLTATNATLILTAQKHTTLIGPTLTLDTDGLITFQDANGLLRPTGIDPLRLDQGSATLSGSATTKATTHDDQPQALQIATEGQLELLHATYAHPLEHTTTQNGASLLLDRILPLLAMATIGTLALLNPNTFLLAVPQRWTDKIYDRWKDRGLELEANERHDDALPIYSRLTRIKPHDPLAWYLLARSTLLAGEPEATLEITQDARTNAEIFPVDIEEIAIIALYETDQHDEILPRLADIAQTDTNTATRLAHDLQLQTLLDEQEPEWWTNTRPSRGQGIDGYA